MRYIRCISIGIGSLILCNFCYSSTQKTYKIIVIGDVNSGKSDFIGTFCGSNKGEYTQIQASDKYTYTYKPKGNNEYKFEIWDTASDQQMRFANKIFYKQCDGIMALYNTTNRESFDALNEFIKDALTVNGGEKWNGHIVICATNSDAYENQAVTDNEGKEFANTLKASWNATSTGDYDTISAAFFCLFNKILGIIEKEPQDTQEPQDPKGPLPEKEKQTQKSCRCPCSKGK